MLSFTASDHARVAAGEITVTWRLWKYSHVKAGGDYSAGFGFVHIDDVSLVPAGEVTDTDAIEARCYDRDALIDLVSSHTGATVTPETILYRVRFHWLPVAPAKPEFGLEEISKRLQRLDGASRRGPWTLSSLRAIEDNPGVRARILASDAGYGTQDFKLNLRKLKALGLTISLEIGYELSELGQRYVDSLVEEPAGLARV